MKKKKLSQYVKEKLKDVKVPVNPAMEIQLALADEKFNRQKKIKKYLRDSIVTISNNEADTKALKAAFEFIETIEAKDAIEAMLIIQMFSMHYMTCKLTGKESNAAIVRKLSNTFVSQMQVLKKYRNKEDQRIVVEHKYTKKQEEQQDDVPSFFKGL